MKNLNLLQQRNHVIPLENIKLVTVDSEKPDQVFICTDDTQYRFLWDSCELANLSTVSDVIACEYLPLNDELCLATADGEVIVIYLRAGGEENVTFCEGGIEVMAWSPDQEIVVFVTKARSLVVMNSGYDPLVEHQLDDEAFGEKAFVNVGWGKKETQFHGTVGKAAAKQNTEDISIEDFTQLDQQISVVWRGDGEYFAVSFVGSSGRMFEVYDKEGTLKYTSEKCANLQAPISWRPTGNWIAIPQVLPNKYTIALFEKNGLRHREIVLPFKATHESVVKLLWSNDSNVLAVETIRNGKSNVYLYTVCNYHWYLKQTLLFEDKLRVLGWHTGFSEGKTLYAVLNDGTYSTYRWCSSVNHSWGLTKTDEAIAAVIDNANALLTNLRGAIVPPPMCTANLSHSSSINQVGFLRNTNNESNHTNRFFIFDSTNQFTTFDCEFERNARRNVNLLSKATLLCSYKIPTENNIPLYNHHWLWISENFVIYVTNDDFDSIIHLCHLCESDEILKKIDEIKISGCIGNLTSASQSTIVYQLTDGSVHSLAIIDDKFEEPILLYDLNVLCEKLEAIQLNGTVKIIALKNQQSLYINDKKLASGVSSFNVTDSFVLFTTLDQLKFIRLDNDQIINERRMERGGELVVTVPKESRTVLQMPRGNLEAIQPRVLSLCIIGEMLDECEYSKAFDLLRKERINLNLLIDHDPVKFLDNLDHFVENIADIHWLNLFLSDIKDEDVTVTMYSSNYLQRHSLNSTCFNGNKIQMVSERMCEVLMSKGLDRYLLPIVTTHVKRNNLEEVLQIIWDVKKLETHPKATLIESAVKAQDALKYLLYLVNINELYDVALGMYDFQLVLFVAEKSEKDPKEYIPFLNELNSFEENYRKYKIDHHLKRFGKALEHIAKCGVEKLEECLNLIATHGLHSKALQLFKRDHECYQQIVSQFADHLRSKGQIFDACLMYERAEDYKQALLSAKHILDWKKCVSLAKKLNYTDDEIERFCLSLIPALQESNRHRDAAEIVRELNTDNYSNVIKHYCDGKHYDDAIYYAKNSKQLIDDVIIPHVSAYINQLLTKIQADTNQFNAYVNRLQTIRKIKADRLVNGIEDDVDDCDLFSDTSSMNSSRLTKSSRGSGKSTRSSKNRRKHERKLLSLKEGNPFEDIALIDALYNLIHKSYDQQAHIREILKTVINLELDAGGIELQISFAHLLTIIKDALNVIWIPEMMVSGEVKVEEIMDFVKAQDEQHYAMIKPHQRCRPALNTIDWQFETLK